MLLIKQPAQCSNSPIASYYQDCLTYRLLLLSHNYPVFNAIEEFEKILDDSKGKQLRI